VARLISSLNQAIHNLAEAQEDAVDKQSAALSPYFQALVENLLQVTQRYTSNFVFLSFLN